MKPVTSVVRLSTKGGNNSQKDTICECLLSNKQNGNGKKKEKAEKLGTRNHLRIAICKFQLKVIQYFRMINVITI